MGLHQIPKEQYAETLKDMRERCFRAVLTMGTLPPAAGKGFPSQWAVGEIVRDSREAYGYTPPRRRFQPTPQDMTDMMPVGRAIGDHRVNARHGQRDYVILFARAYEVQWHMIRDKLGTSAGERSLQRWLDRAVDEILNVRLPRLTDMSDTSDKSALRAEDCA